MTRLLLLCGAVGLLAAGCSDEPDEASVVAAARPAATEVSPLLDYIPAGTPYVIANVEPVPDAVADKLWKAAGPWLEFVEGQMSRAIAAQQARADLSEQERLGLAMARQISGNLSREGLASLGLNADYIAVYGDGLMPVIRIKLNDGALLDAAVGRAESEADATLASNGGMSYFEGGDDKLRVMFALADGQAIVALRPAGAGSQEAKADLLGGQKPTQSAKTDLMSVNAQYDLGPHGTMIVDTARLVEAVLSDDTAMANAMFGEFREGLSPLCTQEMRDIAGIVPRVVSGYTQFNADVMTQRAIVELRPDLAQGLATVTTAMPGLVEDERGLISGAFAADILAIRNFARERVQAILAEPLQCEHFADLMEQLQRAAPQLDQPLPPLVGNFQGVRFRIDDLTMRSDASEPGIEGLFVVGVTSPQALVGMGQLMMPELAELQISYDAEPVPVPQGLLPTEVAAPYLAATNDALGISVGEGRHVELPGFLQADPPPGDAPLMVFSYDMAELARIQRGMMEESMEAASMSGADDPELREELNKEMLAAFDAYNEVFRRVTARIELTENGIEMVSSTYLK